MPTHRTPLRRTLSLLTLVPVAALLGACGGTSSADSGDAAASGAADELRLGYFANLTHAPALIGVNEGLFADELGDTKLTTQVFNAGPDEVEALFAGALDAAYIGPSPTINAYGQSDGDAIRIIAGAASGGAQLAGGSPGGLRVGAALAAAGGQPDGQRQEGEQGQSAAGRGRAVRRQRREHGGETNPH